MALLDLKDLRRVLQYVTQEGKAEVQKTYGSVSPATVNIILRKLIEIEQQGADRFFGERSFDLVAQARSTMEFAPWAPYWLGDTAGGLWLAFKALAMIAADRRGEHFVLHQATALHKLVEGELVIDVQRDGRTIPWENEPYRIERLPDGTCEAFVQYKGQTIREPVRDRAWKLKHLHHDGGRMRI